MSITLIYIQLRQTIEYKNIYIYYKIIIIDEDINYDNKEILFSKKGKKRLRLIQSNYWRTVVKG